MIAGAVALAGVISIAAEKSNHEPGDVDSVCQVALEGGVARAGLHWGPRVIDLAVILDALRALRG